VAKPWVYANCWESIAAALPEAPALIQGERMVSWAAFDAQADAVAQALLDAGLGRQAKVALHLYSCPDYLIGAYGAFKAGLVPVNVNYRYGSQELLYLLDNADAEAVIFHAEFAPRLEPIRSRLPLVKLWIAVAQPGVTHPAWAERFEETLARPSARGVQGPWGRSEDDLLLIYTGGTTGMPKGVMWRQGDIFANSSYGANEALGTPPMESPETAGERALKLSRPLALTPAP
jgi:fatty-acyl-CoA synthase